MTGIQYRPTIPGLVPEIEERHAARFGGYRWKQWLALARQERIDGVAAYRLDRLVDLHSQDAVDRESRSRRKASERAATARSGAGR